MRVYLERIYCHSGWAETAGTTLTLRIKLDHSKSGNPTRQGERASTAAARFALFLSNFTNKSFLYLSFLKQFLSDHPPVLITLSTISSPNESNSASWNGLQAVCSSNFTKKSFLYFGFLKIHIPEHVLTYVLMTP